MCFRRVPASMRRRRLNNCHQFDKAKRREVPRQDLLATLREVLLTPLGQVRSGNRAPLKAELETRGRLDRKG